MRVNNKIEGTNTNSRMAADAEMLMWSDDSFMCSPWVGALHHTPGPNSTSAVG
jgi:hypothetical protein